MTPSPLDVARSISNRECPVKGKVDLVVLGNALRAAIAVGYVRADHGCFDAWGGYSVTRAGVRALRDESARAKPTSVKGGA